jgi:hypothetical protein
MGKNSALVSAIVSLKIVSEQGTLMMNIEAESATAMTEQSPSVLDCQKIPDPELLSGQSIQIDLAATTRNSTPTPRLTRFLP